MSERKGCKRVGRLSAMVRCALLKSKVAIASGEVISAQREFVEKIVVGEGGMTVFGRQKMISGVSSYKFTELIENL